VVEALERVGRAIGFPAAIRVDQVTEFVSRDLDLWAYQRGVTLDFSRPGKPTDNAFIESFNGKFRAECLNAHWFMSLDDARRKCEAWRRGYNEERPHSAIGNKVPIGQWISGTRPALIERRWKKPARVVQRLVAAHVKTDPTCDWREVAEQVTQFIQIITGIYG
jgi:putative transposase